MGFGIPFQALQIGSDVSGMLIAQITILLESLVDDPFQFSGHVRIQPNYGGRRAVEDGFEDHCGTLATERQRTCRHLVHDGAEGKQIASRVQLSRARLLG